MTAGHAIEVPLMTAWPPGTVEMTPAPGPVTLISDPTFEKAAMKFLESFPGGGTMSPTESESARNVPDRPSAETATARGVGGRETDRLSPVVARRHQDEHTRSARIGDRRASTSSSGWPAEPDFTPRLMLIRSQPSSIAF